MYLQLDAISNLQTFTNQGTLTNKKKMKKVSVQKHLACHDYHMGHCNLLREKCPYSHVGKSWGICPNKSYCPTPHKLIDCPLFSQNCCPNGNECSYSHLDKEIKSQEEEQKLNEEKSNPDTLKINEEKTNSNILTGEEKRIKNPVKLLVIDDFKANLLELNQDLKILQPFTKRYRNIDDTNMNTCSLDLCFIIDITGSMHSWIESTISYVNNTLKTIYKDFPQIILRVAFSGYRDYCEDMNIRYECYDFQTNIEDFCIKMGSVACFGGGDTAEDVTGGLYNALQFDWSSAARQVIFIADAPCHGTKYHSVKDDYPKGDPSGKNIEDLMKQFYFKDIEFTAVEVSSDTEKMFCIMRAEYGGHMVVKNLQKNNYNVSNNGKIKLENAVHESVMATVTASMSKSGLSGDEKIRPAKKKLGAAYQIIMQNKRFKGTKTLSQAKDKINLSNKATSLLEIKVEEEEEFDSDDNDYEEKLETSSKKYKMQTTLIRQREEKLEQEKQLKNQGTQFPKHYFETVEEVKTSKRTNKEKTKKVRYIQGEVNWDKFEDFNEYQAVCCSFELKRNSNNGKEVNWANLETRTHILGTSVRLSNLVFSEGAMRYAYHAKDLYVKQKMVAKQYKSSEKRKNNKIEDMKRDILSQIVCKYIVKEFNSRLLEISSETPIILQFIDCYIYEMTFPFVTDKLFYLEKFIDGKYEKFNNNAGYVSDLKNIYSQFAQTLSHFSWQLTKGYLAIVDLQGNDSGILTDPQIHCLDQETFGDGNLGYEGILRFFETHYCNSYCQKLHLIHPKDTYNIPLQNQFFTDISTSNTSDTEMMVSQFCDICQHPYTFSFQESLTSKQNHTRLVCLPCKQLIAKSSLEKQCHSCKDNITFSTYECIQLRRDVPSFCDSCQEEN